MTLPALTLASLRHAGHSVRRQDDRIMIAPPPNAPDVIAEIKANRDGILALLRAEEPQFGWPAEENAALSYWQLWNAAIDARPQEVAQRREAKRTKKAREPQEDLLR